MVSDHISVTDMVTLVQVSAEAQSTFAHLRSSTLSVAGILSFLSPCGKQGWFLEAILFSSLSFTYDYVAG